MGRITEAKFTRRYNIGQYEHEEYSLVAIVDEGDDALTVVAALKQTVSSAFGGEVVTTPAVEEKAAEEKKPGKRGKKKEEPVEEVAAEEEEAPAAEKEEEAVEEKPAKEKKKFKKKPQAYSRSSETHKELFSNLLKEIAPGWNKNDKTKAKAKEVSQNMEGGDFLDDNGNVLEDFRKTVKLLMK